MLFITILVSLAASVSPTHAEVQNAYQNTVPEKSITWDVAYDRAKELVSKLTNEEKNSLTHGVPHSSNGCNGYSGSLERVSFPGFCLQDGPAGVRGTDLVSGFAAAIHTGASWNKDLALAVASYMGEEFKRKGANVALGPSVGPIGRVARGGRNWETYGSDPYLAGAMAAQTIRGLQRSVIASVKHFIGNEQETNRKPPRNKETPVAVSSNIDDRTMHELYLWPFQDAVRAGVGSVMCSYNRLNGTYACENDYLLNQILKKELGFRGFALSDWAAQHSGVQSAIAGLDMAMPDAKYWNGTLANAVRNGTLSQARLDDMATRIIATWYKLGMDDPSYPPNGVGIHADINKPHKLIDARNPASKPAKLQSAREGHVLVKNTNQALPLKAPKLLSLFGYNAHIPLINNHAPFPDQKVVGRWYLGLQSLNQSDSELGSNFDEGIFNIPSSATGGHVISGGGSGAATPSYISAPYDAISHQAYDDDTFLLWDFQSQDPNVNPASDACLVFINDFAAEASDRLNLADPASDVLVQNVAKKCTNTIVVINNAGIRIVDAWIESPNITAVILGHLPGQDSGRALVDILYGRESPSGRLPYTVAMKESDYGALASPSSSIMPTASGAQSDFDEGINIDYRHFLSKNITPRFEFGYGLTYTTFNYKTIEVSMDLDSFTATSLITQRSTQSAEGGNPALWDELVFVTCQVQNAGNFTAAEVAQLYIEIPSVPIRQLRGFEKKVIAPGQWETFRFPLTRRDLSIWQTATQNWVLQRGQYNIFIGASVLDIRLRRSISL